MILSDFIEKTIDNRGKNPSKYYESEKYPVIDNVLIKNKIYPNLNEVNRYIDQETFDSFLRGYVHRGMPLMTLVGNGIGNVTLAPSDDVAIIQNTIGFQVKENLDEKYLYYYLLSNNERIRNFDRGSGQPSIRKTDILGMEVDFPDIDIQKIISKFLYLLDLKIEQNENINKNLEQQAIALYKANFIDFVPYDGKMPSSWRQGTVSEIIEIHDSKRIPLSNRERSDLDKIYPYYGATSIMDYVDKYLFDGIYLLLAEDGTVMDDRGYPILQYVEGRFWVNNHAHILTGKNGYTVELLYLLFKLTNVKSIITGAVQLKISQANLRNLRVVIPTQADLREFDAIIQPLFSEIRNLRAENQQLSAIRDSLLPKLMSGEINVANIDL
ncbi:restriction endonuclease subunit S [Peptoniphilus senegalensis]|uniref:Restriction endonuclease subunit S n=1 Tax=Peptoniphilus senegalensis TaxID=1465757 RepID=A0ABV1J0T0_9FIRM